MKNEKWNVDEDVMEIILKGADDILKTMPKDGQEFERYRKMFLRCKNDYNYEGWPEFVMITKQVVLRQIREEAAMKKKE